MKQARSDEKATAIMETLYVSKLHEEPVAWMKPKAATDEVPAERAAVRAQPSGKASKRARLAAKKAAPAATRTARVPSSRLETLAGQVLCVSKAGMLAEEARLVSSSHCLASKSTSMGCQTNAAHLATCKVPPVRLASRSETSPEELERAANRATETSDSSADVESPFAKASSQQSTCAISERFRKSRSNVSSPARYTALSNMGDFKMRLTSRTRSPWKARSTSARKSFKYELSG
mmetsp:Transcript_97933/g.253261  ORF Transcript_97933/g.253261 Transcript_97933/m.253261 type:complete len:235 (-) Transcript_97933:725-1429(-)